MFKDKWIVINYFSHDDRPDTYQVGHVIDADDRYALVAIRPAAIAGGPPPFLQMFPLLELSNEDVFMFSTEAELNTWVTWVTSDDGSAVQGDNVRPFRKEKK